MQPRVASFIEIKKFKLKQKLNIMTQKKGKPDYLYTKNRRTQTNSGKIGLEN